MKKPLFTPPIIIGSLIFLIIAVTLFFHFRAEDRRNQNMINCKDVVKGMSVQQVIQIMGKPDEIIHEPLDFGSKDAIQYIYLAPLDYNKSMVILIDIQQQAVEYVECLEVE